MKKNLTATIASLALFATVSSAARYEAEAPVMDPCVVSAPRQTEVERAIEASLAELRQAARPAAIKVTAPALNGGKDAAPAQRSQIARDFRPDRRLAALKS